MLTGAALYWHLEMREIDIETELGQGIWCCPASLRRQQSIDF